MKLLDRNRLVEYYDGADRYSFEVWLHEGIWTVYLPGFRGEIPAVTEMGEEDQERILLV